MVAPARTYPTWRRVAGWVLLLLAIPIGYFYIGLPTWLWCRAGVNALLSEPDKDQVIFAWVSFILGMVPILAATATYAKATGIAHWPERLFISVVVGALTGLIVAVAFAQSLSPY